LRLVINRFRLRGAYQRIATVIRLFLCGEFREIARRVLGASNDQTLNYRALIDQEQHIPMVNWSSMRPIQVLFISHSLHMEGAPTSLFELVQGLVKTKLVTATVLAPADGSLRTEYENIGVPVLLWAPSDSARLTRKGYSKAQMDLAGKIRETAADLVFVNTLAGFPAINAAHAVGVPSIWNIRESEPWHVYYSYLSQTVLQEALCAFGRASQFVFVAEATRSVWASMTQGRDHVIHNVLDRQRLAKMESGARPRDEVRRQLGVEQKEKLILCLGTICNRKGQADLIQAFARIPKIFSNQVHIVLKGSMATAYEPEIKRAVAELEADEKVRIHILTEDTAVVEIYQAADIFVCASYVESYPRVILEAMHFSLPIITTDVYGIKEQIKSGVNALSFQPGDICKLERHLSLLVGDDDLCVELGNAARYASDSGPTFCDLVKGYAEIMKIGQIDNRLYTR
jgi:glycosyltransferase involved in cell wall biosynthesis